MNSCGMKQLSSGAGTEKVRPNLLVRLVGQAMSRKCAKRPPGLGSSRQSLLPEYLITPFTLYGRDYLRYNVEKAPSQYGSNSKAVTTSPCAQMAMQTAVMLDGSMPSKLIMLFGGLRYNIMTMLPTSVREEAAATLHPWLEHNEVLRQALLRPLLWLVQLQLHARLGDRPARLPLWLRLSPSPTDKTGRLQPRPLPSRFLRKRQQAAVQAALRKAVEEQQ